MFEIIMILLLIVLNGGLSLIEAAFISSRKGLLMSAQQKGHKNAAFIIKLKDEPERFFSSIQVGITMIGVVSGVFGGVVLAEDFAAVVKVIPILAAFASEIALVLVVSVITYLTIVFGELVPKTIAIKHAEAIVLFSAPVMQLLLLLFMPVVHILSLSTRLILTILRLNGKDSSRDSVKEIVSMIRMAAVSDEINKEQEKILLNTINMTKLYVRDVMIERSEIKYLNKDMSIAEAFLQVHNYHHTRYPLVDKGDLDEVLGYVNFKDIINVLKVSPVDSSLSGISRPIMKINYQEKIIDILPRMIRNNQHISMVMNKDGQTVGLVSLEDIIESVLGDITDEYELLPEYLYKISDNTFIIGGGCTLEKIALETGLDIEENGQRISDWILGRSTGNLAINNKLSYRNAVFVIRKLKQRQIVELILELKSEQG